MALTQPRLGQLLTNVEIFTDSMTVLHGGATTPNVDVGFVFNRANGLVPNAAFYWSESTQSYVTALTANAGVTASNITVQSYANLTVGNLLMVQGSILGVVGNLSIGGINAATIGNTGAQGIFGNVTTSGTETVGNLVTTNGVFWANGVSALTGAYGNTQVAAYLPTYAGNITAGNTTTTLRGNIVGATNGNTYVTGSIIPTSNVAYDLGTTTQRWRSLYLSGNTIDLGGATIKTDGTTGAIAIIPQPTTTNPNPTATIVSASGTITTANTTGGNISANTFSTAANLAASAGTTFANITTGNITTSNISTSALTIGTTPVTTAVYQSGGSLSFNGTSQYLTAPPSSSFAFGSNDFTVEGWFYTTASADQGLWDQRASTSSTLGFACRLVTSTNYLRVIFNNGALFTTTQAVPLNQWNHIAIVRLSGTVTAYLNGTAMTGGSAVGSSPSATDTNMWVGKLQDSGYFYNGYISNFRVVNGTAVYTTNFATPTAPLTAIANTALLLDAVNSATYIADSSTNNFSVTNNGLVAFSNTSPYLGSLSFNGTTGYLTVPNSSSLQGIANTNMTIEFWMNLTTAWGTNSFNPIQKGRTGDTSYEWGVYLTGSGSNNGVISWQPNNGNLGGVNTYNSSTVTINTGTWYHVAISVSGTTAYFFLNGAAAGTAAVALQSVVGTTALSIGNNNAGGNTFFPGYMTNIRVLKGTALYTSSFTPSVSPLSAITNTVLLLNAATSPTYLVDSSTNNATVTNVGSVTFSSNTPFAVSYNVTTGTIIPATSSNTGALVVTGGTGISGNLYVGANIVTTNGVFWANGASALSNYGNTQVATYLPTYSGSIGGTLTTATQNSVTTMAGLTSFGTAGINTTAQGNLTVTGNLNVAGNITAVGNVYNVTITGNSGQFFGNLAGFNALYAGIGTGYFIEPQMVMQVSSNFNGYAGVNHQNINSGSLASTDLFWTPNNGTANDTFLDIGIGSSTYNYPGYGLIGPNDSYIISYGNTTTAGGNLLLSTGLNNDIVFAVDGANANNEVMRITRANVVNIKSTVASANTASGALVVAGGVGIAGNVFAGNIIATHYGNVVGTTATLTGAANVGNLITASGIYWSNGAAYSSGSTYGNTQVAAYLATTTGNTQSGNTSITGTANIGSLISTSGIISNVLTVGSGSTSTYLNTIGASGGSLYFSNSNYLALPASTNWVLSGNFTFECWFNYSTYTGDPTIVDQYLSSTLNAGNWQLWINHIGSGVLTIQYNGGTGALALTTVPVNTWTHVAVVRSGSTITGYVNGVNQGTATYSGTIGTSTNTLQFGAQHGPTAYFNGYITNARLVNGSALYTTNFVPPVGPLTAVANTVVLLDSFNSSTYLTDASTYNATVTNVNTGTPVSWSNSTPYIGGSLSFNGTSQYLSFPNSSSFAFGTGAFTIEGWINATSGVNNVFILGGRSAIGTMIITTGGYNGTTTAGALRYVGSSEISSGSTLVATGTWNHFAITRDASNNVKLYVNGVLTGSGTDTTSYTTTTGTWYVATNDLSRTTYLPGNLTNLRIVAGSAVYTGNFTPPIGQLTAISNTALLLNVLTSTTYITDSSTNNVTVTNSGSVPFSSSTPYTSSTGSLVTVGSVVPATSANTGALVVTGGTGVSGNLYVGGNVVSTGNITWGTASVTDIANTITSVGNVATAIDTFANTAIRTAKYVVSIQDTITSQSQATEILLAQDGANVNVVTYGIVYTGTSQRMTFSANMSAGTITLWATGTSSNNTVKLSRTAIPM